MKLIIIAILIMLLSGCASQRVLQTQKWHIGYLQDDVSKYKLESEAYSDTIRIIRAKATEIINKQTESTNILKSVVRDFVIVSKESIADSILIRHGIAFELPDGNVIGK
ncbi:MAG: hypothetical protein HQ534_10745 [Armatimonadetes bacterium]|nr:hypothetical protein [Armatimonadota bacterium]